MKKILIVNTTINKGGAARVAYDLFENLSLDFDMFFAYGRGERINNEKTFYFGNKIEMFFHIFLVRFLGLEGLGSYFSTKKLIKYIKNEKFDVINLHNLHGYYLNFFLLIKFLKKSKIPIIFNVHDEWPITWLPAYSNLCDHCKSGIGICNNTNSYPRNFFPIFEKYMFNKKRKSFSSLSNMIIICPSVWLKNRIELSFLNKFIIQVICNGVNTDIFIPSLLKEDLRLKHNLPLNKKIILFSASNLNDKRKGIDFIIEVAMLLKNKNYIFVGLGKGNLEKVSNIITVGYIYDKKDLAEIYALSDIFCFASSAETFFLSIVESLSCGIPVVGFDIPVVREIVNNDVGILTEKDSKSLALEINNLLNDENRISKMSKSGRELIVSNYSSDIFYNNYRNLYQNYE